MTAAEAYELTSQGGATDFARMVEVCESSGLYCLIGGLAVNCYVEPVYTLDADIVVPRALMSVVRSRLRIQFTTRGKLWTYSDPRRRLCKRKKDELDLIRFAEAFPN